MTAPWLTDLAALVSKSAPLLGSVLGGPFGSVAGNLIADVFGQGSMVDIFSKVSNDPEAATKLKDIEDKHIEVLKKLSLDDTADARRAPNLEATRKELIAVLLIMICGCGLGVYFSHDNALKHLLLVSIGVLFGELKQAFKLYFGD